jgi:hypothetical protein
MTLSDLLDELGRNMLRDRSDLMSGPDDQLWPDAQLVGYINEAENLLARKGMVIRDGTTPKVTEFALVSGVNQYTLNSSVVAVISVKFPDDVGDLVRAGHSAFNTYQHPDPLYWDPAQISIMPPGKPLAFSTDEQLDTKSGKTGVVNLRVYPEPNDAYDGELLKMRVVRRPLKPLTLDNLDASPEVPEEYHLGLLDWAAYRALRNIDSDAGSVEKAEKYKTEFNEMVEQARVDALRKMFAPLQWGFGRGGFSWVA